MSTSACLALECRSFSVIGSLGEACFGDPLPIEELHDIRSWSESLSRDESPGSAFDSVCPSSQLTGVSDSITDQTKCSEFNSCYQNAWRVRLMFTTRSLNTACNFTSTMETL
ncbi:hypothetical protein AX17_005810 [Amanita inopinata Kibby_2008]|nr:hypothetical protein AX17_005810 [Amanita inopinata Kibby_2008]